MPWLTVPHILGWVISADAGGSGARLRLRLRLGATHGLGRQLRRMARVQVLRYRDGGEVFDEDGGGALAARGRRGRQALRLHDPLQHEGMDGVPGMAMHGRREGGGLVTVAEGGLDGGSASAHPCLSKVPFGTLVFSVGRPLQPSSETALSGEREIC